MSEVKPTRQWDAWTREEEENFFGALRQVGKDFEKITSRVQSKNKDQVRHYYYRVIKRMNKILHPTLILDAKNQTYVNSAMLRWWSLLEKHSCSVSKLRQKPRRFKTFVMTLEHQLSKDSKRAKAKKPTPSATTLKKTATHVGTSAVVSNRLPDLVSSGLVNSESRITEVAAEGVPNAPSVLAGQRGGTNKKTSSNGARISSSKGAAKRPPRLRAKPADGNLSITSKAACTSWKQAASVGASQVAETEENLEWANGAKAILPASDGSGMLTESISGRNLVNVDVQSGQILAGTSVALSEQCSAGKMESFGGQPPETNGLNVAPLASRLSASACTTQVSMFPTECHHVPGGKGLIIIPELCSQVKVKSLALDSGRCSNCSTMKCNPEESKADIASTKLKLQLFPFDDLVLKALEQDGHNPHLELTLKARKSIYSVLHHLSQKWGRSTVAAGELRLFPFNTNRSNVSTSKSWSYEDLNVSAADVHASLGNPAVFRLRYAWLSTRVHQSSPAVLPEQQIQSFGVASEAGPALSEGGSYPGTRNNFTLQQTTVLPYGTTAQSRFVETSTIVSTEKRKASELMESPVLRAEPRMDNARHVRHSSVPDITAPVKSCVAVFSGDSTLRSAVHEAQPDQVLRKNITCSNELSFVATEGNKDNHLTVPAKGSFADGKTDAGNLSISKELENATQVSGCAWLYDSNDGFAQQLWNYEDSLRSNTILPMDWVDSLTNLSVTELLGGGPRAVVDCPQQCSDRTHFASLDSLDAAIAGQESPLTGPMFMPITIPSSAIWGGEETCDAFSFGRQNQCSKNVVISSSEEGTAISLGFDVQFADLTSLRERQRSESQDLLMGGGDSTMRYLIEALAQGSLDEFQACSLRHDIDKEIENRVSKQGSEFCKESKAEITDACDAQTAKDRNGLSSFSSICDKARTDGLFNTTCVPKEPQETLSESSLPSDSSPDVGTIKDMRPGKTKMQRKEPHPPQLSFKLPSEFSTVRSLKLQG